MKIAKEKVWADDNGNLVPDGDASAAVLVATPGQNIPDAHLQRYKGADKFFEDAVFDSNASQVTPKTIAPAKAPAAVTSHMVDPAEAKKAAAVSEGPAPVNREAEMPKRKTRAAAKKPKK